MVDIRLIDANALLRVQNVCKVTEYDETGCGWSYLAVPVDAVKAAPTIDAVPVVHARWRQAKFTQAPLYICSVCDSQAYTSHNYCPCCGAKMDGGADNA